MNYEATSSKEIDGTASEEVEGDYGLPNPTQAVAKWVAKVQAGSGATFDAIINHALTVFDAETDLENNHSTVARDQFRKDSGLSQSMLSKLKQVGKKAAIFTAHKATLPPSLTILYELSVLDDPELQEILKKDLMGKTRIEIEEMVAAPNSTPSKVRNLISFSVDSSIDETKLIPIIKEIRIAVDSVATHHNIPVKVASVAVNEEKKAKEAEQVKLRDEKAKVKSIKLLTREKFKQLRRELARSGFKSKAINAEFVERFGEVYKDALAHSNPVQVYERWSHAERISDDDRQLYDKYVQKVVEKATAKPSKPAADFEMMVSD